MKKDCTNSADDISNRIDNFVEVRMPQLAMLSATAYFIVIGVWAWTLSGSIFGTVLLMLIALFFTWPILMYGLPIAVTIIGLLITALYGLYLFIRRRHLPSMKTEPTEPI